MPRHKHALLASLACIVLSGCGGGNAISPPGDDPVVVPDGVTVQAVDPAAIERLDFSPPDNPAGPAFVAFGGTTIKLAATNCPYPPATDTTPILFVRGGDIWVVNPDGSNPRKVVDAAGPLYRPRWSPRMRQILYDDGNDLLRCNAAGDDVVNLTSALGGHQIMGCWSPDGALIAYADDSDGDYEIWVMNPDGTGHTQVTENSWDDLWPVWSPDSRRLAFSAGDTQKDICTVNADGSKLVNVTGSEGFDETEPSWSPAGFQLAFTRTPVGGGDGEIAVCSTTGDNLELLTDNNRSDMAPCFAPDGQLLVFAAFDPSDIFKLDVGGGGVENVTWGGSSASDPWWVAYGSYRVVVGPNGADSGYDPALGRSRELVIIAVRETGLLSAVSAIAGGPATIEMTDVSAESPVPMIDLQAESALRVWEDRGRGVEARRVVAPADAELEGCIRRAIIAFNRTTGRISSIIAFSGNITTSQSSGEGNYSVEIGQGQIVLRGDFLIGDGTVPASRVVLDATTGEILD